MKPVSVRRVRVSYVLINGGEMCIMYKIFVN